MKKIRRVLLFGFIFCTTLLLVGCQLISDFVIVNSSGGFIEITYDVKDVSYKSLTPLFITIEEFNDNDMKWRPMSKDRYEFIERGTVLVKLAPQEVFRLESVNFSRFEKRPEEEFNTRSLTIKGNDGTMHLEGKEVVNRFKPVDKSWALIDSPTYVLYYAEH